MSKKKGKKKDEKETGLGYFQPKFETYPKCPTPGHGKFKVDAFGMAQRKSGPIQRYRCTSPQGKTHLFTENSRKPKPPSFLPAKCEDHPNANVIRWGGYSKDGVNRQSYVCDGPPRHKFSAVVPRARVAEPTDKWEDADAVVNPNRGELASARGHTSTAATVATGLQKLAEGTPYSEVGKWAWGQKPTRIPTAERLRVKAGRAEVERREAEGEVIPPAERAVLLAPAQPRTYTKKVPPTYWHLAADWCELYAPVLFENWLEKVREEDAAIVSPRVLAIDDVPFYGGRSTLTGTRKQQVFTVISGVEYFATSPGQASYQSRARLLMALPRNNADAYELMLTELDYIPDAILSDRSPSIKSLVQRLRKSKPSVAWIHSPWHLGNTIRELVDVMLYAKGDKKLVATDLVQQLDDRVLLVSSAAWKQWWADLEAVMDQQQIPQGLRPTKWKANNWQDIYNGLVYVETHPGMPRGTGKLEGVVKSGVKSFIGDRARTMTNIDRTNRLLSLRLLYINGMLDNADAVAQLLIKDAVKSKGFAAPAREIVDVEKYKSLRDPDIIASTLRARKAAGR